MKYDCKRRPELYKMFKAEFDLLDKFDFLVDQIYNNSNKISFPETDAVKEIIWFLTGKAAKSYNATKILCEQGYGTDALVIERTMIDLLIAIKFILEKDSRERATMFASYEWVLKQKAWHFNRISLIKHDLSENELKDHKESIKEEYEKACEKYKHFSNWRMPWTGEPTAVTAERLGLKFYYEIVYSYVSDFVHSSPTSAKHYFKKIAQNHTEMKIGASEDLISVATVTLIIIMCEMLFVLNDTFSLGKKNKIIYFKSRLDQYTERLKKGNKNIL